MVTRDRARMTVVVAGLVQREREILAEFCTVSLGVNAVCSDNLVAMVPVMERPFSTDGLLGSVLSWVRRCRRSGDPRSGAGSG